MPRMRHLPLLSLLLLSACDSTEPKGPPVPVGEIPPQVLCVGRDIEIDMREYFEDPDGDVLSYAASVEVPAVASVSALGSVLTVTPIDGGETTITLSATDPDGADAVQTFPVTDPTTALVMQRRATAQRGRRDTDPVPPIPQGQGIVRIRKPMSPKR